MNNNEQLLEKFLKLPEDIQAAIWDLDLDGTIGDIGLKYDLHLDEIGVLADQTALVLIGINPLSDFTKNLAKELPLQPDQLNAITNDVNQGIFLKIQESLKKIHAGERPAVSPAVSASPDSRSIFEEKMAKLFRVPREEVDLEKQFDQPQQTPSNPPSSTPDPYREISK